MKRCRYILLMGVLIFGLCGCANTNQTYQSSSSILKNRTCEEYFDNCCFFFGDVGINLYSVDTGKSNLLCFDSQCSHQSDDDCFARQVVVNSLAILDDTYYYLYESDWNQYYIESASLTGENRRELATITGAQQFVSMTYEADSKSLYYAFLNSYEEAEFGMGDYLEKPQLVMYRYDIESGSLEQILDCSEYGLLLNDLYIYEGKLYGTVQYTDQDLYGNSGEEEISIEEVYHHTSVRIYCYDEKEKTMTEAYNGSGKAFGTSLDCTYFYVENNDMIVGDDKVLRALSLEDGSATSIDGIENAFFVDSLDDYYMVACNAEDEMVDYYLLTKTDYQIVQEISYSLEDTIPVAGFDNGIYYMTNRSKMAWVSFDDFWNDRLSEEVIYD